MIGGVGGRGGVELLRRSIAPGIAVVGLVGQVLLVLPGPPSHLHSAKSGVPPPSSFVLYHPHHPTYPPALSGLLFLLLLLLSHPQSTTPPQPATMPATQSLCKKISIEGFINARVLKDHA